MENPLKNSKDFFNQEDYDRLVKEGVTEFAEYSSLPVPDDPDVKPTSTTTAPTNFQTTQSHRPSPPPPFVNPNIPVQRGTSRRNFLIVSGTIGLGVLTLGYAALQRTETPPQSKSAVAPTTRPAQSSTPIAKVNPQPNIYQIAATQEAAKPGFSQTQTARINATEAPPLSKPAEASKPSVRPVAPKSEDRTTVFRRRFPSISLSEEVRTPGICSLEVAQDVMGEDFFGPEQVEQAFNTGMRQEDIPIIPFDKGELERAKSHGQFLVLRASKLRDGSEITASRMGQLMNWERLGFSVRSIKRSKWALTSKELLEGTAFRNAALGQSHWPRNQRNEFLLIQTQAIAKYLKDVIFKDEAIPKVYNEALSQFESDKVDITYLLANFEKLETWQKIYNLNLSMLFRHRPIELVYDLLVYEQNRKRGFFLDQFAVTLDEEPTTGGFLSVGRFNPGGVIVHTEGRAQVPNEGDAYHGVLFTRS